MTVAVAVAGADVAKPSFAVTVTVTVSPFAALPRRSKLSDWSVPVLVLLVSPFTRHVHVNVSVARSASWPTAVATTVSFLRGVASFSDTVTVGAEPTTIAVADDVVLENVPSDTTSSTARVSPRSPFPATPRSNVSDALGPDVVLRTRPLTFHVNV